MLADVADRVSLTPSIAGPSGTADPPERLLQGRALVRSGAASTLRRVTCPYCGEPVDSYVDPGGGEFQEYIEDCAVCCRPIRFIARWVEADQAYEVEAHTEDE
jgi:hypothetical protein